MKKNNEVFSRRSRDSLICKVLKEIKEDTTTLKLQTEFYDRIDNPGNGEQ